MEFLNGLILFVFWVVVGGGISIAILFASLNHFLGDRFTTELQNKLTYPLWIIFGLLFYWLILI